jgi:hypothetical protein
VNEGLDGWLSYISEELRLADVWEEPTRGRCKMPTADHHDWITFHRVQFAQPVCATDRSFPPVPGAKLSRLGPQAAIGADGRPWPTSELWGGFSIWASRAEAEAVLADPIAAMPWLNETTAAWHCLAVPFAHRGEVNLRGTVESGSAIRPAATDPGGPLAIITSAGFDVVNAETLPRIIKFLASVIDVIAWFRTMPTNLRATGFQGRYEGRDGITFTLWKSDEAMQQAAYHPGHHRARIDDDRAGLMTDRTSFTRLRVLKSQGDWDGDPFLA